MVWRVGGVNYSYRLFSIYAGPRFSILHGLTGGRAPCYDCRSKEKQVEVEMASPSNAERTHSAFALPHENTYTHSHPTGQWHARARSALAGVAVRRSASGRIVAVMPFHAVKAFLAPQPRTARPKAIVARTWVDCSCGRQRDAASKWTTCQHGGSTVIRQAGVEVWSAK
jgi:hypothetical protein